jgi:hypothetical protein
MRTVAFLVLLLSASAHARPYAVVVAENRGSDPRMKPLEFADDDGVKTWELLSLYSDRVSLFAVLDSDTARLHPAAAPYAEVPERSAILARLARYNEEMAADQRRGDEPELFFIYAGHGDIDASGQGYISLADGRLTRAELYRDVIAASKARFVHVVIDACKSYYMVNSRGREPENDWRDDSVPPAADRSSERVRAFLTGRSLDQHPRAGVIVATSGDQKTHEWSRYRGGVFSHELRSALAGAADVNGDGRVEYSELRAFLAAANAHVVNPEARLDVFAHAPALDRHHPIIDLGRARGRIRSRRLHFGAELSGAYFIEDERGIRYADMNKEPGSTFDLLVDAERAYWVRHGDAEQAEVRPGRDTVEIAALRFRPFAFAERGSVEESFLNDLFAVEFGHRFYQGFVATSGDLPVAEHRAALRSSATRLPRHLVGVAFTLGDAPAGGIALNEGVEVRWAYLLRPWLDLGVVTEVAHGDHDDPNPGHRQDVTRVALMASAGIEFHPVALLGLRLEAAAGWQLLAGTIDIGATRLTGAEARGLRIEAGGGLSFRLWNQLSALVRGGLALDGVYPGTFPSSTRAGWYVNAGLRFAL